jgi:hypothetical protein
MKSIEAKSTVRSFAAILVTVAVIGLSAIAMPGRTHDQNAVTLKGIQTHKATTFYADHRTNGIWFVEAVLTASDSKAATENLEAVAATL